MQKHGCDLQCPKRLSHFRQHQQTLDTINVNVNYQDPGPLREMPTSFSDFSANSWQLYEDDVPQI